MVGVNWGGVGWGVRGLHYSRSGRLMAGLNSPTDGPEGARNTIFSKRNLRNEGVQRRHDASECVLVQNVLRRVEGI